MSVIITFLNTEAEKCTIIMYKTLPGYNLYNRNPKYHVAAKKGRVYYRVYTLEFPFQE